VTIKIGWIIELGGLMLSFIVALLLLLYVIKQELRPLISDIEQSLLALVSTYYSLPSSQGRTLRKLVADSVVSLAVSMQCLLRALDCKNESQRWTWSELFTKTCICQFLWAFLLRFVLYYHKIFCIIAFDYRNIFSWNCYGHMVLITGRLPFLSPNQQGQDKARCNF